MWTYELPSLTLRRRDPVPSRRRSAAPTHGDLAGGHARRAAPGGAAGRTDRSHVHGGTCLEIPLAGPGRPGEPAMAGDWVALPVHASDAVLVRLVHLPTAAVRAEIALGPRRPGRGSG